MIRVVDSAIRAIIRSTGKSSPVLINRQKRRFNRPLLEKRFLSNGRKDSKASDFFSIDRSGLLAPQYDPFPEFSQDGDHVESPIQIDTQREEPSPLTSDLKTYIKLRGPISVHDFMAQALNHSVHGYYQQKLEKIGSAGDFITSPEVSQLFGEMIAMWCFSVWQNIGSPRKINLVELGPGNGTLTKDVLRAFSKFSGFNCAVSVHLVELSVAMRELQYAALVAAPTTEIPVPALEDSKTFKTSAKLGVYDIAWHSFFHQIDSKDPVIAIGQEFLDAFPVHQFSHTEQGWRERLVDINTNPSLHSRQSCESSNVKKEKVSKTRHETSVTNAPAEVKCSKEEVEEKEEEEKEEEPCTAMIPIEDTLHFRFVLAPGATPASKILLKADADDETPADGVPVGAGIEISPMSLSICEDISHRIAKCGGGALFIDYGEDFVQEDSLRGFKKHQQVHVLSEPGRIDITADVNFAACASLARKAGTRTAPLLTQGEFLMRMGIITRVERLLESPTVTDEQAEDLVAATRRLVDPAQMGSRFKVLQIVHPDCKLSGYGLGLD